jgi:O-antigen/teichoic acid export membrane protein
VALGAGVWGLATAVVIRAAAGSATVVALGPLGPLRPRWSWSTIRPFVGFGAKFQAAGALLVAREQGLNVLVAAVAGVPALGVWNLAWRVLQLPALFFLTISRVAFPAMSRLLASGEDARPLLERSVEALGAITGVAIAGLVGFAPALPVLVGSGWGDVPAVILWSGVALTIGAPVTTATLGYLYAAGAAGVAVVSTLASGLVWFAGTAALLPVLGPPGIAVAWIGNAAVQAAIVGWRAHLLSGASLARRAAVPAAVTLVALAMGWLAAHVPHERLLGGVAGFVAAELVLLAGLALFSRSGLRDATTLVRQGLGSLALRRGSRP